MKKIVSFLLAMMMILSLATSVFAAETEGSIKIEGAAVNKDAEGNYSFVASYDAYKMFDLVSYDTTTQKYSYQATAEWADFITGDGKDYFQNNENGYVEWVGDSNAGRHANAAILALSYAKANGLSPVAAPTMKDVVTDSNGVSTATVLFSGLELGYYLVDSSMGVLCGLTTTNPNASMSAKNAPPTISKQVQEDSLIDTGASYDSFNDASIGETVRFDTTITVHAGAQNYHLYDKMDASLTFDRIETIKHIPSAGSTTDLLDADYDLQTTADGFEIIFSQDFCNRLGTGDKIAIVYLATLNQNAVIYTDGNKNETWLTFGEDSQHSTEKVSTMTYTYGFDLVKTDSQRTLLPGATFRIYDAETGGNEIKVKKVTPTDGDPYYRLADATERDADGDLIEVEDGLIRVVGLDSATYYLEEISAPPGGYNKLTARKSFTIDDGNLYATLEDGDTKLTIGTGVQVVNKSGTILPQTGGIGTTLFVTIGAMVVMATGVLLVTKKRMSMIED